MLLEHSGWPPPFVIIVDHHNADNPQVSEESGDTDIHEDLKSFVSYGAFGTFENRDTTQIPQT